MHLQTVRLGWVSPEHEGWLKNYGATIEGSSGSLSENRMRAAKGSGSLDYRISPSFEITGALGATGIDNLRDESIRAIPSYSLNPHYEAGAWRFNATVANDCVYQEWVEPGVVDPGVTEQKFEIAFEGPITKNWKTRASYNYLFLSDSNERHSGDGVILYQLVDSRLNLAGGFGIFSIGFKNQTGDYWTPREFANYTARFEANYQLSSIWNAYAAFHIGPATDLHSKDGLDVYYEAHLSYTGIRDLKFEVDWDELKAYRPEFRWTRDDVMISISGTY